VDFSRMIVHLRSGFLAAESFWFVPALLVVAFAGSYTGKLLLNKIPQKSFRRIVLALVFLIGLTTLGGFIRHLLAR
jgi:uncharacterized membrane protein YfcA